LKYMMISFHNYFLDDLYIYNFIFIKNIVE
jgi:hypothetical protein